MQQSDFRARVARSLEGNSSSFFDVATRPAGRRRRFSPTQAALRDEIRRLLAVNDWALRQIRDELPDFSEQQIAAAVDQLIRWGEADWYFDGSKRFMVGSPIRKTEARR